MRYLFLYSSCGVNGTNDNRLLAIHADSRIAAVRLLRRQCEREGEKLETYKCRRYRWTQGPRDVYPELKAGVQDEA